MVLTGQSQAVRPRLFSGYGGGVRVTSCTWVEHWVLSGRSETFNEVISILAFAILGQGCHSRSRSGLCSLSRLVRTVEVTESQRVPVLPRRHSHISWCCIHLHGPFDSRLRSTRGVDHRSKSPCRTHSLSYFPILSTLPLPSSKTHRRQNVPNLGT